MSDSKPEYILKLTLLGDYGVGKTSFVKMLIDKEFITDYKASVKADISPQRFPFEDRTIIVYIWDLPGQEQYKEMDKTFLLGADLAIFMYDVTRKSTLESIKEEWFRLASERANPRLTSILLGNKTDLKNEREVSPQEGQAIAEELGILWVETSIKDNQNVSEALNMLISKHIK